MMITPRVEAHIMLDNVMLKYFGMNDVSRLKTQHYVEFAEVLGHPRTAQGDWIVDIDNPEVMRLLALLDGPHWKTVLKIIEARR